MHQHAQGFTLLELLITLVIVAILTGIAYPLYTQHLRNTRRAQAAIALMQAQAQLTQHYVVNQSYQGINLAQLAINQASIKGFYQLELRVTGDDHYLLRANPQNSQTNDTCGSLHLTDSGNKSVGGSAAVDSCW